MNRKEKINTVKYSVKIFIMLLSGYQVVKGDVDAGIYLMLISFTINTDVDGW